MYHLCCHCDQNLLGSEYGSDNIIHCPRGGTANPVSEEELAGNAHARKVYEENKDAL